MRRVIVIALSILAAISIVVVVGVLFLRPLMSTQVDADFKRPGILAIELDGLVVERAPPDLFRAEFEGAKVELIDLILALDRAADDERIAGVFLRIGAPGYGWAKAEEMRSRLARFRESGKFVYAFTTATDELGYYVALAADSIYLLPDAGMALNGFRFQAPFVRPMLGKLGLDPQVEAIGAYKTAADMFRRESMSDEHREVAESILAERYDRFVDTVVETRGVDRQRFVDAMDGGVYLARDLSALGLIDGERYEADVRKTALARATGVGSVDAKTRVEKHFVGLDEYMTTLPGPRGRVAGTIGLVYAVGAITGGESEFDPVFGRTMGAKSTIKMLREVSRDNDLDAVVIRVDSPGGDALASEEIWAAIEDVNERVPIIVSMSDVAGSGGYLISAGADEIVAEPSTITGSIGVFGVLFNAEQTWDKLGIEWETVRTNPGAEFPTTTRSLTEAERQTFRTLIEDVYRSFVQRVANGRELPVPEVDAVAQGRVWTGTQAEQRGLVDRVGGLETALVAAKEAAGIAPDASVRLHIYPAKQRFLDRVRELLLLRGVSRGRTVSGLEPMAAQWARDELGGALTGVGAVLREGPRRPLAVMPYVPETR
jgi:protease-4